MDKKFYSLKKERDSIASAPQKPVPSQAAQPPQASQVISLLGTHRAPQAFLGAFLASVSRDTAVDQIAGESVQELFRPHFVDQDQNFITTIQQSPLTPPRTKNEYRPEGTFTLLLNDGTPFSWGELFPSASLTAPALPSGRSVVSMTSSRFAVTVLLDDGSLISWGKDQSSLTSIIQAPPVPKGTKVISIASTPTAFAALLDNGKILARGNFFYGGGARS